MKLMYKIMIFMTVFYGVSLMINSLGIFPEASVPGPSIKNKTAEGIIESMFIINLPPPLSLGGVTGSAIAFFIVFGAIATYIFVQSPIMPAVIIVGYLFSAMILNSYTYIQSFFQNESTALSYLGICIGAGLIIIILITVVEMVAHGASD